MVSSLIFFLSFFITRLMNVGLPPPSHLLFFVILHVIVHIIFCYLLVFSFVELFLCSPPGFGVLLDFFLVGAVVLVAIELFDGVIVLGGVLDEVLSF